MKSFSGLQAPACPVPLARDKHSAVVFGDRMLIFGGWGPRPEPWHESFAESFKLGDDGHVANVVFGLYGSDI